MHVVKQIINCVDNITPMDAIAKSQNVGICNVISATLNADNKLCRGKLWTPHRVKDIYKKFSQIYIEDGGEHCEICNGLDSTNENPIILCDCCDRGFHMKCVRLAEVPEEKFFCSMLCHFKQF